VDEVLVVKTRLCQLVYSVEEERHTEMARGDMQPCGYGTQSEFGSHLQHLHPSCTLFCIPPLLSSLLPLRLCPGSPFAANHGQSPTGRTCCSGDFGATEQEKEAVRAVKLLPPPREKSSGGGNVLLIFVAPLATKVAPWPWLILYQSWHKLSWASSLVYKEKKAAPEGG